MAPGQIEILITCGDLLLYLPHTVAILCFGSSASMIINPMALKLAKL